ncbi:EF hand domain/PKD domain protein [Methanosarcina mazei S-6]|uniref:EF hand domain/PKD domain protein n=1 Tax=Methanosarcina mazei S-6 TaxID=213585 RepID=A0A0E3RHI5_METMZ|nr:EF hand domain/PKD domain protein [Methanosarcina mazei S-6]
MSSTAAAASKVTLQPSSKSVYAGENITLNVVVTPDTQISGIQFDLEYDGSLFQAADVTEGNLFSQSGQKTFFSPGQTGNGRFSNIYGCVLGSSSVSTPETFATITLKANTGVQGTSQFYLKNVTISSSASKPVDVRLVNTGITISDSEAKKPRGLLGKLIEGILG